MKGSNIILLLLSLIVVAQSASVPSYPDGAFFTVKQDPNGAWWFVDPNNKTFWSKGMDVMSFNSDPDIVTGESPYKATVIAKYGDLDSWASGQVTRALRWGINTWGAWVHKALWDTEMPYTIVLSFYSEWKTLYKAQTGFTGVAPDLYNASFKTTAQTIIRERVLPHVNNPYLLGYYLDNEIHLGTNWWRSITLYAEYVNLSTSSAGWQATQTFIKGLYPTVKAFKESWGLQITSFTQLQNFALPTKNANVTRDAGLFDQQTCKYYFDTLVPLVKSADPNHLILGVKWNGMPNKLSLAVETSDVISIDWYRTPKVSYGEFDDINTITGKPLLIGEYCYRGNDTGHLNTRGGGTLAPNQKERASLFSQFIGNMSKVDYIVGAHWFRFIDEPHGGRYDGENSNMGVVNETDFEYTTLTTAMTNSFALADTNHGTYRSMAGQKGPITSCPSSCSSHGCCHAPSGRCFCEKTYSGGDCSYLTGKLTDAFTTVNTKNWVFVTGSNNWYTTAKATGTYSASSSGLTLTVVKDETDCPGRYWKGPNFQSVNDYAKGWYNFSYKAHPSRFPRLQLDWFGRDKWSDTYGVSVVFNHTSVGIGANNNGPITWDGAGTYTFPYNISLAFHNYAILWDLDDNVKIYADNVLVAQSTAPAAEWGLGGFIGNLNIKYYMSASTCDVTTLSAVVKNVNYEIVKKTCPNSCSGKGCCDYDTGKCACNSGYLGNDCSAPISTPPARAWLQHISTGKFVLVDSATNNLKASSTSLSTAALFAIKSDLYGGYTLKNEATNYYVIARSGGTGVLGCYSTSPSTWESISFSRSDGWSLWSYINSKFSDVIASGTNAAFLQPTLDVPSTTSKFNLLTPANITTQTTVRIISKSTGYYWYVDSTNALVTTSASLSTSTVFKLGRLSNGYLTLQSATSSLYASGDQNLASVPVMVDRTTTSSWEQFTITARSGNAYTITADSNDKNLAVTSNKVYASLATTATIIDAALFYIINA